MTEFYFVRHGKTENNHQHRFNGSGVESPLTKEGIAEIKTTGQALKNIPFTAAFSSPQPRAEKTAELILNEHQRLTTADLQVDPNFKEIRFGQWDGKSIEETKTHPQFQLYFTEPEKFDPRSIGAESYQDLANRGLAGITRLQALYPKENDKVLIVSHGVLLLTLLNQLVGVPIKDIRKQQIVPNASLTILKSQASGPFETLCWGKTFDL